MRLDTYAYSINRHPTLRRASSEVVEDACDLVLLERKLEGFHAQEHSCPLLIETLATKLAVKMIEEIMRRLNLFSKHFSTVE